MHEGTILAPAEAFSPPGHCAFRKDMLYFLNKEKETGAFAMRRLWIERRKAAAAGTVAMMVYTVDAYEHSSIVHYIASERW